MANPVANQDLPAFNTQEILKLFIQGEQRAIAQKFLELLGYFENKIYVKLSAELQLFVDEFLNTLFYIFSQSDFDIPEDLAQAFIRYNKIVANLAVMSTHETTDNCLKLVLAQRNNLKKALTLYSPRNHFRINYNKIFLANPKLACYWYSYVYGHYLCVLPGDRTHKNMLDHLTFDHPNLTEFFNHSDVYFGATYIDGDLDRILKAKMNRSLQIGPWGQNTIIINRPNPKKIAIVSGLWYPGHSVYRTLFEYVDALKEDYELTFIYFGKNKEQADTSIFHHTIYLEVKNGNFDIQALKNNEFSLIYFADVGMTTESIFLANLRLAPIQCCGVGHSVSTFGSLIDYYISGQTVEIAEGAEKNYSERLVLLPGDGVIHNYPIYKIKNRQKTRSEFIVNCPWSAQKVNCAILKLLDQIRIASDRPLLYRFFSGSALRQNALIGFTKDIETILPSDSFEVVPGRSYEDYMALMEEGDICLDSYHFGGCNTVIDSLYLGKPTIAYPGTRWYNRIGAQILRRAGLTELIARNAQEYLYLTVKLIRDDAYRQKIKAHLQQLDLEQTILNRDDKQHFKRAIAYLLANHETLLQDTSHKPILIAAK